MFKTFVVLELIVSLSLQIPPLTEGNKKRREGEGYSYGTFHHVIDCLLLLWFNIDGPFLYHIVALTASLVSTVENGVFVDMFLTVLLS